MVACGEPNTTPARRQSCDRCYGQKLRCVRDTNSDIGTCVRCLRQGAQCAYSPSLPKGRPSANRSETWSGHPSEQQRPASRHGRRDRRSVRQSDDENSNTMSGIVTAEKAIPKPTTKRRRVHDDIGAVDGDHISDAMLVDSPNTGSLGWHESQTVGDEQQPALGPLDFNLDTIFEHPFNPTILDRGMDQGQYNTDDTFSSHGQTEGRLHQQQNQYLRGGPSLGIAQLSQLSARLSQLNQSSEALDQAVHAPGTCAGREGSPLVNDAVFKLVVAWLVDLSTSTAPRMEAPKSLSGAGALGGVLCDIFSTSGDLLEILRSLHTTSSTANSWDSASSHDPLPTLGLNGESIAKTSASAPPTPPHQKQASLPQHCNLVVCHLLIACHTMLLGAYDDVLGVLQRGTDQSSCGCFLQSGSYPSTHSIGSNDSDKEPMDTALADVRLVMVVQLCSYLVNRQHQSVSTFLASQRPSSILETFINPAISQQSGQLPCASNGDLNNDFTYTLMAEVQQRIDGLMQSLRI